MIDLDALERQCNDRRISGPALADVLDVIAELRASRKVVEAAKATEGWGLSADAFGTEVRDWNNLRDALAEYEALLS